MWVWYGGPASPLWPDNLCAFRYFSELLIRAARQRSVLKDRYLQTAFLRLDTKALDRARQIQKLHMRWPALAQLLGSRLRRRDFSVVRPEVKPQAPFTWHALSIHFRRREGPLSRCLQGEVREELARPWRIKLRSRYTARRINVDLYADAHLPMNRGAGFLRNVRQNLIQHFTLGRTNSARGRFCSFLGLGSCRCPGRRLLLFTGPFQRLRSDRLCCLLICSMNCRRRGACRFGNSWFRLRSSLRF